MGLLISSNHFYLIYTRIINSAYNFCIELANYINYTQIIS